MTNRTRRRTGADRQEPWLMPPRKRKMPKIVRKLLMVLALIALLIIVGYIYLLLNPSVWKNWEITSYVVQ